jgi:hypothetical protein
MPFIGRLALVVFLAKVVDGLLYSDRHDSLFVRVPYVVVSLVDILGFLLLLALLIAVGVQALARRIQPRT